MPECPMSTGAHMHRVGIVLQQRDAEGEQRIYMEGARCYWAVIGKRAEDYQYASGRRGVAESEPYARVGHHGSGTSHPALSPTRTH